ncbi:MAG TPA: M15 family metallopeptidase [Thermoanaerobaculia bacterium]|nr:M15 family metallopeptidase [Thermoanaerobaculia bacterium]
MKRAINFIALVLLVSCASGPPANQHGLQVVPDLAAYERLATLEPQKRLLDLSLFNIPLDIRYATENNFMKKPLYPVAKAYLRVPAARALLDAYNELYLRGLGLKVYDAYRPYRVTVAMWEPIRNPDFVADPAKGSRHNRGAAVDVTLIDRRTGAELPMPTEYDDFTPRAAHDFMDLPSEAIANRTMLRDVMMKHGFEPLPSEWWHYDFRGWEQFELMDVGLEELSGATGP